MVLRDAGEMESPAHSSGLLLSSPEQEERDRRLDLPAGSVGRWGSGERAVEPQLSCPALLPHSGQEKP